jgi:hypothetical protein
VSTIESSLRALLERVTKRFVREKERDDQEGYREGLRQETLERLRLRKAVKEQKLTIKKAAWSVMKKAYMLASDNGSLPATIRQVMYAARKMVIDLIGKCWKKSSTFTQDLLPEYMAEHEKETAGWDVVADARGHFAEPHSTESVGLGTLEIRNYINSWTDGTLVSTLVRPRRVSESYFPTSGPTNRFKFALFVEKEGFMPLLQRAHIAERFDMAIFSSKGMSVIAARKLVDRLSQAGVTILIAHDFDKYGMSIAHWLSHDNDRFRFTTPPKVIDLGLRLKDVQKMKLQSETLVYEQKKDPGDLLREIGVPQDEIAFLVGKKTDSKHWSGQRVELNAMTSRQIIDWIVSKFAEVGVEKVVPKGATLAIAWKRSLMAVKVNEAIERVRTEFSKERIIKPMPSDVEKQVREMLRRHPEMPWDAALAQITAKRGGRR